MKKLFLVLVLMLTSQIFSSPVYNWAVIPSGTTENLKRIKFVNVTEMYGLYTVGDAGVILKSYGYPNYIFSRLTSPISTNLVDIITDTYSNQNPGIYILSIDGKVLRSTDGQNFNIFINIIENGVDFSKIWKDDKIYVVGNSSTDWHRTTYLYSFDLSGALLSRVVVPGVFTNSIFKVSGKTIIAGFLQQDPGPSFSRNGFFMDANDTTQYSYGNNYYRVSGVSTIGGQVYAMLYRWTPIGTDGSIHRLDYLDINGMFGSNYTKDLYYHGGIPVPQNLGIAQAWNAATLDEGNFFGVGGTSILRGSQISLDYSEIEKSELQVLNDITVDYSPMLAVGNSGVILKTGEFITGVQNNNSINKYELNQNYPNPFNPVTKIKYQIAKTSDVSLKIYDISGREVQTLVNDNVSAGTHEAIFDGTKLSSGTYFYRIQTGEFTETKKMMLIK